MIVIIGAGPAGLSAAYHLGDEKYTVLESEAEPGGLCRSFDLGGATFDLGGHAFFTKHDYVRDLVEQLCEPGVFAQPREAWVHSHDTFVRYPFQSHLHGLPSEVVEECLVGLYEAARRQPLAAPPANLREWIELTFGPGIAARFLLPYNEKLWAFPLTEIAPGWTSNRVVTPDVAAIVGGALRPDRFSDFPNAVVRYPATGGFANLYQGFLRTVGERIRRHSVVEVRPGESTVRVEGGATIGYDHLVSTMPLDELVRRTDGLDDCCRDAAGELRHNSLHLVNLVFDRPAMTEMQRVYCADPEIPFHKLVLNSNSNPELRARPCFGIQAEVSFSAHKRADPEGLTDRVLAALRRIGIAEADDRVSAASVVTLPRAYPVQTSATVEARTHLLAEFQRRRIHCAGRFGEWLYINSDDAVLRGRVRAEEILAHRAGSSVE
ncbi:protoporphyrinogen/coproporphyrinogen oxidase [Verrucosispora sp. TAA-831]|uniref:protoporphyrinogen/coproporphyrinogen oxidase n=1 Tax=Verrucosispora sp. TAA-831 TaxID=3422227 RepID=UPI003D6EE550